MPPPTGDPRSKPPQPPADVGEVHPRLDRLLKLMRDEAQHPKVRDLAAKAAAKLMHPEADFDAPGVQPPHRRAQTKPQQTKAKGGRPAIGDKPMTATERWRRWRARANGET